jgi:hypothetical protein
MSAKQAHRFLLAQDQKPSHLLWCNARMLLLTDSVIGPTLHTNNG